MFLNYGFVKWLLLSNYLVPGRLDFFKKLDIYSDYYNRKRFKRHMVSLFIYLYKSRLLRLHIFRDRFQYFKKISARVKTG